MCNMLQLKPPETLSIPPFLSGPDFQISYSGVWKTDKNLWCLKSWHIIVCGGINKILGSWVLLQILEQLAELNSIKARLSFSSTLPAYWLWP